MLHGVETWGPKAPELQRLYCNDLAMIRWICGIKDKDKITSAALLLKLGDSDGMAIYNGPRPASNVSQTFHFPALERKEGLIRHGLNV